MVYIDKYFFRLKIIIVRNITDKQNQRPQQVPASVPNKPKEKSALSAFDSFPGRKALVERTPLIKHTGPRQTQEELQRIQNAERSTSNSENQQFLKDVSKIVIFSFKILTFFKFNKNI